MGDIIQFPRKNPYRRWSPEEILAIKEPPNTRQELRKERSRIATSKKIATGTPQREKKRAERKQQILAILDIGEEQTVTSLMDLIGDRIGRQTVADCLAELEAEGLVYRVNNRFWISTKGLED